MHIHTHTHVQKYIQAYIQTVHTYIYTQQCVFSQQHKDCHLQIQSSNLLLKIQAVIFIRRQQPKPSFLRTKGHVCGGADISTPLALTHSLQRQRLCLVTHRDSVSGSTAWYKPVLPQAAAAVFFLDSFRYFPFNTDTTNTYIKCLLNVNTNIHTINKAQLFVRKEQLYDGSKEAQGS